MSDHSVTYWIKDLKEGRGESIQKLWDRYFDQLVGLAHRKLGNAEKRVADEEDIASDVFRALYDGAKEGRFEQLQNRQDLWLLLVAITGNKAVDLVRRQTSQKRGGGEVRGHSIFKRDSDGGSENDDFGTIVAEDPTPDFLVAMNEECSRLFDVLQDDAQREIVRCRLAGYTNKEIAETVGLSLRSVERKLEMIRSLWSSEI